MAGYRSMSSLAAAMRRALVPAVNTMARSIEEKVDEKVMEYYQEYSPVQYDRTGTMSNAPQKTDAVSTGNGAQAEVYTDTGLSYNTGTWSMQEVWESANKYLHGGKVPGGVSVWDAPISEAQAESRSLWLTALRSAGLNVR